MASGRDSALDAAMQTPARSVSGEEPHGFEDFFRRHYAGLVRFLRQRTATAEDAEDAAQESYTRLLRYRDTQPASAWRPLLYRIATNVAIDQHRRTRTRGDAQHVPLEDEDVATTAEAIAPDRQLVDQERLARVLSVIRGLPDKRRHVFLLSRFHGMSNREIAERCGISVRMVEKQIGKALAACRVGLQDEVRNEDA